VATRALIGISGWRYPPWRGDFYPTDLPQRAELAYAAAHFPTIEINGSFYSLQRPEFYRSWCEAVPDDFVFAVKGSRYITHMLKLRGIDTALANFFASGVLALGAKLGPFLWQLPPMLRFEPQRLTEFFERLPRSSEDAVALARKHDRRVAGRAWLEASQHRELQHALEVRHPSFVQPQFIELLRRYRVALVVADTAGRWPFLEDITSDFVYVRLHGDKKLYESGYTAAALERWAEKVRAWRDGEVPPPGALAGPAAAPAPRNVYVYFDNDVKVRAPYDALSLMAKVAGARRRRSKASAAAVTGKRARPAAARKSPPRDFAAVLAGRRDPWPKRKPQAPAPRR
jgi:uncharacterized protein YecE (DUF72 family)